MKTIGLIGGMSWESTQTYYRLVNQHVRTAAGRAALCQGGAVQRGFCRDRGAAASG